MRRRAHRGGRCQQVGALRFADVGEQDAENQCRFEAFAQADQKVSEEGSPKVHLGITN